MDVLTRGSVLDACQRSYVELVQLCDSWLPRKHANRTWLTLSLLTVTLQSLQLVHMMVRVVLPLIPWFGIRGAGLRFVSLPLGLMLIMRLFLALLVS